MANRLLKTPPVVLNENEALELSPSDNKRSREALLAYHVKQGHLLRVRRGLYAVVPDGSAPETFHPDPYVLAAKMATDAVLAYHTALEVHGKAHSVFQRFFFLTKTRPRPVVFRSLKFESVKHPAALLGGSEMFGVKQLDRSGVPISVTSLERTLVDLMDRPDLAGGWEEIWRSLESVEFFDLDKIVEYALLLRNATTAARVGFFLEQHRESLMVEDRHLEALKMHRPKNAHYMERGRRGNGRLVPEWNLIVPLEVIERSWQEPQ